MLQSTSLSILSLAAAALAAPGAPYAGPFGVLNERNVVKRACPTAFYPKTYSYSTTWKTTTDITNVISSLVSPTSTKTEHEIRTVFTQSTLSSLPTVTQPVTTTTVPSASTTTTIPWWTVTITTTLPGFAPTSDCQVTTRTSIIPTTSSVTWTQDTTYVTHWLHLTGRVSTTTSIDLTTSTRTITNPATTWLSTATHFSIYYPVAITTATLMSTVWEKGCERWACDG